MSQLKGLNLQSPTYRVVIPSTEQELKFRSFTVKEEKILMIASESKDMTQIVDSLKQVIANCLVGDVNVDDLAVFDLEYLFLKLRSKSVGETAKVALSCLSCETSNDVEIDLGEVEVVKSPEHTKIVKVTTEIGLEMEYPTFDGIKDFTDDTNLDAIIDMVASSIKSVFTGDEVIDMSTEAREDVVTFLEQFTSDQFALIQVFFNTMPKVKHEVSYTCKNKECKEPKQAITLEGLGDFF